MYFAIAHTRVLRRYVHYAKQWCFCAGNSENPPAKVPLVTLETLPNEPDESQPPVLAEPVPTQPHAEVPDTLPESLFQDAQSRNDELLFPDSPSKGPGVVDGSAPSPSGSAPAPPVGAAPAEEEESEPGDSVSAAPPGHWPEEA